jgi:hypothetical protein
MTFEMDGRRGKSITLSLFGMAEVDCSKTDNKLAYDNEKPGR